MNYVQTNKYLIDGVRETAPIQEYYSLEMCAILGTLSVVVA